MRYVVLIAFFVVTFSLSAQLQAAEGGVPLIDIPGIPGDDDVDDGAAEKSVKTGREIIDDPDDFDVEETVTPTTGTSGKSSDRILPEEPKEDELPLADIEDAMQEIIPLPNSTRLGESNELPQIEKKPKPKADAAVNRALPPPPSIDDVEIEPQPAMESPQPDTATDTAAVVPPPPPPPLDSEPIIEKEPEESHLPEPGTVKQPESSPWSGAESKNPEPIPVDIEPVEAPSVESAEPEAAAPRLDGEVATLDGVSIGRDRFEDILHRNFGRKVMEMMINETLLKTEIKRRGITITPIEVEEAFQKYFQNLTRGMKDKPDPDKLLMEHMGLTASQYKENVIWVDLAMRKLVEQELNFTDSDLFNHYYANRKNYTSAEEVRASHILIDPVRFVPKSEGIVRAAGAREWGLAQEKAMDLLNRIQAGADFAAIARKDSDDSSNAKQGGDLGFFPRGTMVKPFEDAAFKLKTGEISELVKTLYGYHIIKLTDRSESRLLPFSQIKDKVRTDYQDYMLRSHSSSLLMKLRQRAWKEGRLKIYDPELIPSHLK